MLLLPTLLTFLHQYSCIVMRTGTILDHTQDQDLPDRIFLEDLSTISEVTDTDIVSIESSSIMTTTTSATQNTEESTRGDSMEQTIGNNDREKEQDEPHPKRPCLKIQQNNNSMPSLNEALSIPQLGTVNIGQQGDITHNYGLGNHQIHVTHCGADGTQNIDLG